MVWQLDLCQVKNASSAFIKTPVFPTFQDFPSSENRSAFQKGMKKPVLLLLKSAISYLTPINNYQEINIKKRPIKTDRQNPA